jgi:hypothetical protein
LISSPRFLATYTIRTKDIEIAKSAKFDATYKLVTRKIREKRIQKKTVKRIRKYQKYFEENSMDNPWSEDQKKFYKKKRKPKLKKKSLNLMMNGLRDLNLKRKFQKIS